MARKKRDEKTYRRASVELEPGAVRTLMVRRATSYSGYVVELPEKPGMVGYGTRESGWVRLGGGEMVMVERTYRSCLGPGPEEDGTWRPTVNSETGERYVVEGRVPRERRELSPEEYAWLEAAFEACLLEDTAEREMWRKGVGRYVGTPDLTPREVMTKLFRERNLHDAELLGGAPVPEGIIRDEFLREETWNVGKWWANKAATLMNRLHRRGVAKRMYGDRKGRGTKVYIHAEND